jgi:hypothetical protein
MPALAIVPALLPALAVGELGVVAAVPALLLLVVLVARLPAVLGLVVMPGLAVAPACAVGLFVVSVLVAVLPAAA